MVAIAILIVLAFINVHWRLVGVSHSWTEWHGIHPRALGELAHVIAGPLSIIFQWFWESGEVPANWKLASVVPVFKKGKKEDPGNGRPVSLTSVPGKITETVVLEVTEKHLRDSAVIGRSQHRPVREKSCITNLIPFYDKVLNLTDQGMPIDVMGLDFSKAFGTVSHSILLDKCPAPSETIPSCAGWAIGWWVGLRGLQ